VGTPPQHLLAVARAVYSIRAGHSGMYIGVSSGTLSDGASVVQQSYSASDDRFHWYVTPHGEGAYQLMNRRTGSCLDLQDPRSATSKLVQRRCAMTGSQSFFFNATGEGSHVLWTINQRTVDVPNGSTSSGAQLGQGGNTWQSYNKLTFAPITAGEPHRLTFDRQEPGGPCGNYYWYDVAQPNTAALDDPASTYVQLIFAGGKQSQSGGDVNPFIAQQVSGNQVAIDPTYGLNDSRSTTTGSCTAACLKMSTTNVDGQCCSCNGTSKKLRRSVWSATTFICQ
jgi:ricin-type beta-trefoil lectin protein